MLTALCIIQFLLFISYAVVGCSNLSICHNSSLAEYLSKLPFNRVNFKKNHCLFVTNVHLQFATFSFQAKMLEEMDAQFGIGNLIEEEFGTKNKHVNLSLFLPFSLPITFLHF